jgi:hypothetical protein
MEAVPNSEGQLAQPPDAPPVMIQIEEAKPPDCVAGASEKVIVRGE